MQVQTPTTILKTMSLTLLGGFVVNVERMRRCIGMLFVHFYYKYAHDDQKKVDASITLIYHFLHMYICRRLHACLNLYQTMIV